MMVTSVYSAPPFTETSTSQKMELAISAFSYFDIEQDFKMHVHVYGETGKQITPSQANCSMHVYNISGNHILQTNMTADSNGLEFTSTIGKGNFTYEGEYRAIIWCSNSTDGGFKSETGIGNRGGKEKNPTMYMVIIIAILGIAFLMLKLHEMIDNEHWLFKIVIIIFIPLLFILGSSFIQDATQFYDGGVSANGLFKITIWFMSLLAIYFFIYLFYTIMSRFVKTKL